MLVGRPAQTQPWCTIYQTTQGNAGKLAVAGSHCLIEWLTIHDIDTL
jgi:hypothetical protein